MDIPLVTTCCVFINIWLHVTLEVKECIQCAVHYCISQNKQTQNNVAKHFIDI